MAKIRSGILYQGPSLIDGAPIVVIAIGKSRNSKTGNMVQTYIIRSDIAPLRASATGADFSICGNCPHRGQVNASGKIASKRSCYVNIAQGVTQVYKAFIAGKYPILTIEQAHAIGADRMVRLGTYGDPAAVPFEVFDALLSGAIGHTGYTHQAFSMPSRTDKLMVSADSVNDAIHAHSMGQRTFRVIPISQWRVSGKDALLQNEILCPASEEAGKRTQCADCKLCAGSEKQAKSIAIVAHGTGKTLFA